MKIGYGGHRKRIRQREGGFMCGKPWAIEDHTEASGFVTKELKGTRPLARRGPSSVIPL